MFALSGASLSFSLLQVIWNSKMREEVSQLMEASREDPASAQIGGFRFDSLRHELVVAGVFVRVYIQQPEFEVAEPDTFARVSPSPSKPEFERFENICTFA